MAFYLGLHFESEKGHPNFRKTRSPIVENPASVKNGYLRTGSIYFPWPFTTIADWLRLINVSTQDCCQMAQPRSFHFPDHWAMLGSQTNIRIPALRYFWRVAPASGSPGDRAPASASTRRGSVPRATTRRGYSPKIAKSRDSDICLTTQHRPMVRKVERTRLGHLATILGRYVYQA